MSAPLSTAAATEALTIGRAALQQLHDSLLRDTPDLAVPILQEVGFAAGAGVFQAFCTWLPVETGVARPEDLDAGRLNDVLSAFFQATGWGSVSVAPLGNAALVVDSSDWAESTPGSAQEPMCFFSSGMLAAVMEVECRSRNDERCRFLSASPDTLNEVYEQMKEGRGYEEALR